MIRILLGIWDQGAETPAGDLQRPRGQEQPGRGHEAPVTLGQQVLEHVAPDQLASSAKG